MWRGTLKEPGSVRFWWEARSLPFTRKAFIDLVISTSFLMIFIEIESGMSYAAWALSQASPGIFDILRAPISFLSSQGGRWRSARSSR